MRKSSLRTSYLALLSAVLLSLFLASNVSGAVIVINPTDDTFIDEISPGTNFGSNTHFVARRGGTGFQENILIDFDLSSVPSGASINSATLFFYYSHNNDGDPAGRPLDAHHVTGSWTEGTVTWNNQPSFDAGSIATATVPGATGTWMSWDLTSEVQDIVDGATNFYGWEIIDHANSGFFSQIHFRSKENPSGNTPYLQIDYGEAEQEWEGPTVISTGTTEWWYPRIAVSGDYVHVIWRDGGASLLKYCRSTDGGDTWQAVVTLNTGVTFDVCIAASGSDVHVVWQGLSDVIKYLHSSNNGATFAAAVDLTSGSDDGYDPDVTAAGANVYVTWIKNGFDVGVRASTNSGSSWGSIVYVTNDGATTYEESPRIAASGSYVYLAWIYTDPTNVHTQFSRSSNNGGTWSTPSYLWTKSLGTFGAIAIAAYGNNVYLNRQDDDNGPCHKLSANNGSSFSGENVLGNRDVRGQPDIDVSAACADSGVTEYIEQMTSQESDFYATYGCCSESWIDEVYGSSPSGDIGVDASGNVHAVCSSREAAGVPPYRIHYYRRLVPAPVTVTTISPSADAFVNSAYPTTNYGSSTILYVGDQNGNNPPHTCRTYLKFPLSSIPADQEIASAWVYAKSSSTGGDGIRTGAYYQASDGWTEGGLTWNSQPSMASDPADEHHGDHVWNCWNVTADVGNAYAGDGTYSVVLKGETEPDQNNWIGCSSREESFAQYRPYLEVSYRSTACDCTPGDANDDATVNISDAVYLISYIFAGGPAPTPYAICSGDANCDCVANITDAVYLITYIFAQGPAPCTCQQWLAVCGPPLR